MQSEGCLVDITKFKATLEITLAKVSGTIFQRTVLGKQNFLAGILFIWRKTEVIYPSEHYSK